MLDVFNLPNFIQFSDTMSRGATVRINTLGINSLSLESEGQNEKILIAESSWNCWTVPFCRLCSLWNELKGRGVSFIFSSWRRSSKRSRRARWRRRSFVQVLVLGIPDHHLSGPINSSSRQSKPSYLYNLYTLLISRNDRVDGPGYFASAAVCAKRLSGVGTTRMEFFKVSSVLVIYVRKT